MRLGVLSVQHVGFQIQKLYGTVPIVGQSQSVSDITGYCLTEKGVL